MRVAWVGCVLAALGCSSGDDGSMDSSCPAGAVGSGTSCASARASQAGSSDASAGAGARAGAGAGARAGASAGVGGSGETIDIGGSGTGGVGGGAGTSVPPQGGATAAGTGGSGTAGNASPTRSRGCAATDAPPNGMQTIDVDGTQREFITAVPDDYDASKPYKLIFAWHAERETAQQIAGGEYYGLESMAAGSAIFVAGQGLDTAFEVGRGPGWDNMGGRDVAFARAMLDFMRSSFCIDEERIFSIGMSYGGVMTNTVGCALGEHFRAIAPMSGLWPSALDQASCVGQVAVWLSHGATDTAVTLSSGQASRDYWVAANHCETTTSPAGSNGCVAYQHCDDGHPIVWCEFTGGHTVPTFASAEVWEFFSQF